jgi:hypothetical protein
VHIRGRILVTAICSIINYLQADMNPCLRHLLVSGRSKNAKIITKLRRGASAYLPPACLGGELILAVREVLRNVIAH